MSVLGTALEATGWVVLVYMATLQLTYGVLTVVGWRAVDAYVRRRPLRDYAFAERSSLSSPVSIIVPAYNEEATIVESVRALLQSRYANVELVVVNDGSSDGTLDALARAFDLVATERVPRAAIPCAAVRRVHRAAGDPRLLVVDKENGGGKADALNAGLRYATCPLVCAIDADTLLDPGALARLAWEFQADPSTVAAGGIVRILNGSEVEAGLVTSVHTPRRLLLNIQILEYLRAFLGGRVAWSRLGMLIIISGAFGLFRREALVAVGGWDTTTVGEDAELVLRLHRWHADHDLPCRITFFPDPICWTEAPSRWRVLVRQRDRWQRGLIELLTRHRAMLGRRRYGRIGTVALPFFLVFECLGPIVECAGYPAFAAGVALGLVSPWVAATFLALAIGLGLALSFATLLIEQRAFRRHPGWADIARLVVAALVENLGYRQAMALVRARSWLTIRRAGGWGEMPREGFATSRLVSPLPPRPAASARPAGP